MTIHYDNINKRIDMDLLSRSSFAIVVYCIIFPAILYPFDLYVISPLMCWTVTGMAMLLSIIRVIHLRLTPTFYDRLGARWMGVFHVCSILHATILSALFVVVTYNQEFHVAYMVTFVVCAGMSAAAMSSFSPSLFMALAFPSIVLIPTILITLINEHTQSTGYTMFIFWLYLMALAVKSHKEYMRTFTIEEKLERQKKELETLSRTDALTGLYNRGYFNTLYDMVWESCVRNNTGITLIMMDVDHFKSVNDKYGHITGDECLKIIARCIEESLGRKNDISCRFGGEEFAVLMSSTPIHESKKIAEKIRKSIECKWIETGEHRFQVTASFGVANILPKISDTPTQLIEQADQAMYRAKKAGRNCVCC